MARRFALTERKLDHLCEDFGAPEQEKPMNDRLNCIRTWQKNHEHGKDGPPKRHRMMGSPTAMLSKNVTKLIR